MENDLIKKTDNLISHVIDRADKACDQCVAGEIKNLSNALLVLAKVRAKLLDGKTEPPTASDRKL